MYLHITAFVFQDSENLSQGLSFLRDTFLPAQKTKEGFQSGMLLDNGENALGLVLRFEQESQAIAAKGSGAEFLSFCSLLTAPPVRVIGKDLV